MAEGCAETNTNADCSGVEVRGKGEPAVYFHPDSEVIFILDDEASLTIEREHERLNLLVTENINARFELEAGIAQCLKDDIPVGRSQQQRLLPLYEKAEQASEALRLTLHELKPLEDETPLLSRNAKKSANGITELIRIKKGYRGYKYTYVMSDKIKNHTRRYELNSKDRQSGSKSFIKEVDVTDENGLKKKTQAIDATKLRQQLLELKPKMKLWEWEILEENAGVWGQWAKDLNSSLASSPFQGERFSFDSQAQLMRWSYGATANTGLSLSKGQNEGGNLSGAPQAKINSYSNFALAEARTEGSLCIPDRNGWLIQFPHKNGGTGTLGTFMFELTLTLSGSLGASLAIELGADIREDGIKGIPGKANVGGEGGPGKRRIDISKTEVESDQKNELSVFAGLEYGANLAGAIKWKNPEKKTFTQLAKLGAGVDFQAGVGYSALLAFSYNDGKVRCHAKAGLCWGAGAKGSASFEVDIKAINEEFIPCLAYMLRNIDYYKITSSINREHYYAFCSLPLLIIGGYANKFVVDADEIVDELLLAWSNKERRVRIMQEVNSSKGDVLKYALPEARGATIAAMMEKNFWDKISIASNKKQPCEGPLGSMSARKLAILNVLRWVQSKRDYENTMQHLNMRPEESNSDWRLNRDEVYKFLATDEGARIYPFIGSVESSHYAEKLDAIYASLPSTEDIEPQEKLKPVDSLLISGCLKLVK